ncbi:uncharacterized protein Z518_04617 [Rhinocladiella mackenziei CBS 650.93]|uniref:Cytochrome P450 monooxygenase n=1 Tax=Rhinocladiella mackenziei CBS 650.93 TaxID=1442369 RepID=A0A0D2ITY9_9EURO|nr:uncharacterized protein Z518_04617 [Rhinocladiella mackenziei CBS 650.93]KIX06641.1 hypothetical protein Z518_04617 [Rhinocladiella mackenziei CBS 650.93]
MASHAPVMGSSGFPVSIYTVVVTAVVIFGCYILSNSENALYPGFDAVGLDPKAWTYADARKKYAQNAKAVLWEGLKKCKGAFQVYTMAGPRIVLDAKYLDELKNWPHADFAKNNAKQFFGNYPALGLFGEQGNGEIIQDTVRIKLTQSLNRLTPILNGEARDAWKELAGDSEEWHEFHVWSNVLQLVARVSAITFIGPELCRDKNWIDLSVNYAVEAFDCVRALRTWPKILRPIVHWFLPQLQRLRQRHRKARQIIEGEWNRRQRLAQADPDAKVTYSDGMQWLHETAKGRPYNRTDSQLTMAFAAIHTTSDLITKAIFDIAANPEIIEPLREEMKQCLANGFTKTALYTMKLLDSVLKESQRMSPSSYAPCMRRIDESFKLSDGTVLPKGAQLAFTANRNFDSAVWSDPDKFDARRFLRLRSQPGQENAWQFVTANVDQLGFGAGQHACPGRFFASNETKIALCHLLLKYDIKLATPSRPSNFTIGAEIVAPVVEPILIRRRFDLEGPLLE